MNDWIKIFGNLKRQGVNHLFNDLNRRMILGISAGDTILKQIDALSDEFEGMLHRYMQLTNNPQSDDIESIKSFIKQHTDGIKSYRHHIIDMEKEYDTIIEYFVFRGDVPEEGPAAKTLITTSCRQDGLLETTIHATIIIFEDHPSVGEDTMGKIVKHELTHVLLELMEHGFGAPIWNDAATDKELFDSKEELQGFEEFLCDYIQWDSSVGPNEDPIDKFRDVMKTYLTWIASDLYEPYINAVEEYYRLRKDGEDLDGEKEEN